MPLPRSHHKTDAVRSPKRVWLSCIVPLILLLAFVAQACLHLDGMGWRDGFSHPLMGWDHLLTMLAVGIWAAQLRGHAIWMLPAAFVGVMSLGGFAGALGLNIPSVEGIILLSCAVFSVLITRRMRFSAKINLLIVAFFAFFHGYAHGQEVSTSASLLSYTLGFMLATLLLHGAGILVAKLLVVTLAFMLGALFSTSALAKASSGPVTHALDQQTRQANLDGVAPHAWQLAPSGFSRSLPFNDTPAATAGDGPMTGKLRLSSGRWGKHHHQAYSVGGQATMIDGREEQTLLKSLAMRVTGDAALAMSWLFKRHFPQINHTPGKRVLSNGAGLTSPPLVWISAPTHPRFAPPLRKTRIHDLEAFPLRSPIAQRLVGKTLRLHHPAVHAFTARPSRCVLRYATIFPVTTPTVATFIPPRFSITARQLDPGKTHFS